MLTPELVPSQILAEPLRVTGFKFSFVSRKLQFPNGTGGTRDYILHPGGAIVVPVTAEGKFVCLRQYRFAVGAYIYEFPAGTLEINETPEYTIRRELPEETGMTAHRWDNLGQFYLAPGYSDEIMYAFLARDLEVVPNPPPGDEDEDIEVVEFTPADMAEQMATTTVFDAKTMACFWRASYFLSQE